MTTFISFLVGYILLIKLNCGSERGQSPGTSRRSSLDSFCQSFRAILLEEGHKKTQESEGVYPGEVYDYSTGEYSSSIESDSTTRKKRLSRRRRRSRIRKHFAKFSRRTSLEHNEKSLKDTQERIEQESNPAESSKPESRSRRFIGSIRSTWSAGDAQGEPLPYGYHSPDEDAPYVFNTHDWNSTRGQEGANGGYRFSSLKVGYRRRIRRRRKAWAYEKAVLGGKVNAGTLRLYLKGVPRRRKSSGRIRLSRLLESRNTYIKKIICDEKNRRLAEKGLEPNLDIDDVTEEDLKMYKNHGSRYIKRNKPGRYLYACANMVLGRHLSRVLSVATISARTLRLKCIAHKDRIRENARNSK